MGRPRHPDVEQCLGLETYSRPPRHHPGLYIYTKSECKLRRSFAPHTHRAKVRTEVSISYKPVLMRTISACTGANCFSGIQARTMRTLEHRLLTQCVGVPRGWFGQGHVLHEPTGVAASSFERCSPQTVSARQRSMLKPPDVTVIVQAIGTIAR